MARPKKPSGDVIAEGGNGGVEQPAPAVELPPKQPEPTFMPVYETEDEGGQIVDVTVGGSKFAVRPSLAKQLLKAIVAKGYSAN